MEPTPLRARTAALDAVPLVWAAATPDQSHVNIGDALSPVMVALLSSLPIVHASHNARGARMAAVGTIGQMLQHGDVTFWGTGVSRYRNPHAESRETREPFAPFPETRYRIAATRGPISRALLNEENAIGPPAFGDPVWLLPQFYRPPIEKKWDLGVIVHLSELSETVLNTKVRPEFVRYEIPEEMRGSIHIIQTRTAISAEAMRERLDEILACRRIVSTSLHGMVFAESYGIPCLHFAPRGRKRGVNRRRLDPNDGHDLRITDLYLGLGRREIPVYAQPRRSHTNWDHVMRAIDLVWEPTPFDYEPLLAAFPLDFAPLHPRPGETVFDHPLIRTLPLQPAPATRPPGANAARLRRLTRLLRGPLADPADATPGAPRPSHS